MTSRKTSGKSISRFSDRLMRNVGRVAAFHPTTNSPGKRDVSCAFRPEAQKFLKYYQEGSLFAVDNTKSMRARMDETLSLFAEVEDDTVDVIAFFCHGWKSGMQLGFRNNDVDVLTKAIQDISYDVEAPIVALYCCSVAEGGEDGEGSFADKLRDSLCRHGSIHCTVVGHYTVGHTTRNPNVRVFTGAGSQYGSTGGYRFVSSKSPLWRPWKNSLKEDLRFRFPTMTLAGVHKELIECYL